MLLFLLLQSLSMLSYGNKHMRSNYFLTATNHLGADLLICVFIFLGGRVLLFDRKMLRNFRKDGYNWKKKKDGKTVQEAHEKLKVRLHPIQNSIVTFMYLIALLVFKL